MGEKRRRAAAAAQAARGFDRTALARAFQALGAGDRGTAQACFEAAERSLPDDADALNAAGVLALKLDLAARAEPLLRRAVAANPNAPALRSHLAIALRRQGDARGAIAELEAALRLDNHVPELHANLGTVRLDLGEFELAHANFERALALRPDFADALNGRGSAALALGDFAGARVDCARAVALDPRFHEAHYNLARACTASRAAAGAERAPASDIDDNALSSILVALELGGDREAYWIQFEEAVHPLNLVHPPDPRLAAALLRALAHPAVDPVRLLRPIVGLATTHPAAVALAGMLPPTGPFDAAQWPSARLHVQALLDAPLLQRLLEAVIVPHVALQRLLAAVRSTLLAEWTADARTPPSLSLDGVAAIAQQGFNTEYVNDESPVERAELAALRAAIEAMQTEAVPPHWHALYACYRPLHTLAAAEARAGALAATSLGRLAMQQILEPAEERRLAAGVPALASTDDPVSHAVREQYEANPYPRWQRVRRAKSAVSLAEFLRSLFPADDHADARAGPARILVAGCGTGRQCVETAQAIVAARMLAVDLSRASLGYAMRKTREAGLAGIEYVQADLLALAGSAERFDLVACTGVLHHLRDPMAGWRILRDLLAPGGYMRIGLYSETARRHVVRARELIARERFPPTAEGIRACRAAILERERDDALLARVVRGGDFFSLSGCRDLLFHVQETRFTLPRIADALAELECELVGFQFADNAVATAYGLRFPGDPRRIDLRNWQRFEDEHPDTFARMYQFWARRRV